MPLQLRRGTTSQRLSITPLVSELVYDTTTKLVYVGDGVTAGGIAIDQDSSPDFPLGDLSDINLGELSEGDILRYDGENWVNSELSLNSLDAVTITTPANNDIIKFNGTTWVNSGLSFSTLPGINLNSPEVNQVLKFNGTSWSNENEDSSLVVSALDDLSNVEITVPVVDQILQYDGVKWFNTSIDNLTSDVKGSVFADDSSILVDAVSGTLVGPLATSGLAADLNLNGFNIFSNLDSDISINTQGAGNVILQGSLSITSTGNLNKTGALNISASGLTSLGSNATSTDADIYMTRNSYSSSFTSGFTFAQHHNTADSVNFTFYRTRGTGLSPAGVQDGDELGEIAFLGTGTSGNIVPGASVTVFTDGSPSINNIPTRFAIATSNGVDIAYGAELSSDRTWKIDRLGALNGGVITASSVIAGDIQGSVFADDSTIIIDGTEGGKISTPSVTISDFLQLPVFANDAARSAAITTPAKGMVIMMEAGTTPLATNQIQFFNGTNWISL
jgi:hypothetical protein